MDNDFIHLLIDRWLNGTCTPEEAEQLQQYFLQYDLPEEQLTDDPRYHPAKKQSERMYARLTGQLALNDPGKVHTLSRKWILRIAAAVIPFILIISAVYFRNQGSGGKALVSTTSLKQISNHGEGLYQVKLTDGSTVWLNKHTSLVLDTLAFVQERNITLNGEAYFEVAHDPAHPFRVTAGGLTTEVLGTIFNIKIDAANAHTTVTLFTGKVSLATAGITGKVLSPGQAAMYDTGSGQLQTMPASTYALAWKTKEIVCENESFESIIDYLEAYYGMRITNNNTITGKHFSGTLSLQGDVSTVLDRLLFVHQLHHRRNGDSTIVIY